MSVNKELLRLQEKFLFRNDLTSDLIAQTTAAYDRQAEMYATQMEWAPRWLESMIGTSEERGPLLLFLGLLRGHDSNTLIDAGCGTGKAAELLKNEGYTVIALDNSAGMLEEAKERVAGVNFIKADVREDLAKVLESVGITGKVDGIMCNSALTHIRKSEMHHALANFAGVLNHGGVLFIGLKYTNDGRIFMDEKIGMPRYFTTYSETELDLIKRIASSYNLNLLLDFNHPHSYSDKPMWRELFFQYVSDNGKKK